MLNTYLYVLRNASRAPNSMIFEHARISSALTVNVLLRRGA